MICKRVVICTSCKKSVMYAVNGICEECIGVIQVGDEVENPEGTVSGVVYKIEDGIYHFVDEHSIKYRMSTVIKASYLKQYERWQIIQDHKWLFKKMKR